MELAAVATPEDIVALQEARKEIMISPVVKRYIADIVAATRTHRKVRFGASPRGSLGLMKASQALALIRGRTYVVPDDIKELLLPVLEHRIILHHDERTRGADARSVLDEVISSIAVPVPQV